MKKGYVTFETNLSVLKFMNENRVIDKITSKRMKSLKQAILDHVYIPPILIDTDCYILDGQHRATAALSLQKEKRDVGLLVYMIDPADTNQTSIEIARTLNSTQKKWSISDFEKSFVNEGRSSYVACAQLSSEALKEFGIKLSITSKKALLNISEKSDLFKKGEIKVSDEDYNTAIRTLEDFFQCSDCAAAPMNFSVSMIKAFINARKHPNYNVDKLQEHLEENEIEWPDAGANESTFMGVFKVILDELD